ncbi:hypothetical protein CCY99_05445 [Helicobacter sp. 16-1353]|nr:hypothetical protein CCY99_05445 [Helicobacter sp. 16-1353]
MIFITAFIFAFIVVLANYSVQFKIGSSYLTYGALIYPFSFLFLDILSEKYNKKDVLKMLRYGILFAFLPSFFISQPSVAIASIFAFFISQHLDVYIFFMLKKLFPKLWWLRNNASTIIAQFFDTMIFFHIAFLATWGFKAVVISALLDFSVKIILSLINTPFFYIFAIRVKNKIYS